MAEKIIKFEAHYRVDDDKHKSKKGFNTEDEAWDFIAQQICESCKKDYKDNPLRSPCGYDWQVDQYEENKRTDLNKINLIQMSAEEVRQETERMNKSSKEHPEDLLLYLYHTGQVKDLKREDFVKINKRIREKKEKEGAFYHEKEITEEEINKYLQNNEKEPEQLRYWEEKAIKLRQKPIISEYRKELFGFWFEKISVSIIISFLLLIISGNWTIGWYLFWFFLVLAIVLAVNKKYAKK